MEQSRVISDFCKNLSSFCNNLHLKSTALKESVDRRPIPLDSATSTFTRCLNRRVTAASTDLNLLDSMAFGTVSFEELLGHCNEVYKKNERDLIEIEDRLAGFGYVPEMGIDGDEDEGLSLLATPVGTAKMPSYEDKLDSVDSIMKKLEMSPLFEESFSLQKLGLSDVCLATLASEDNNTDAANTKSASRNQANNNDVGRHGATMRGHFDAQSFGTAEGKAEDLPKSIGCTKVAIKVSKDDYDSLPSFMKSLTSWEDLNVAVEKMNSSLCKQPNEKENLFYQHDLEALGLGPKVRSYLLLLLRMNLLIVETINGSIAYRVI
ncbi:hypothetical protein Scep_021023 [Stephania cephalantha]|uniref:Spindle and kinetochore-associated protein 3 n=1 Tax=Stephania cephalantha TaxID=152367 RepID=A0AAP0F3K6_9MAGN